MLRRPLALVLLPLFLFEAQAMAGTIFCRQLDTSATVYTLGYETDAATQVKRLTSFKAGACKDGKLGKQTAYDSFGASPISEAFPYGRYIVSNAAGGGIFFSLEQSPSVCPNLRPWPPKALKVSPFDKKGCFSGELVDIAWLQDGDDPKDFSVKLACNDVQVLPQQPCRTELGPFY